MYRKNVKILFCTVYRESKTMLSVWRRKRRDGFKELFEWMMHEKYIFFWDKIVRITILPKKNISKRLSTLCVSEGTNFINLVISAFLMLFYTNWFECLAVLWFEILRKFVFKTDISSAGLSYTANGNLRFSCDKTKDLGRRWTREKTSSCQKLAKYET